MTGRFNTGWLISVMLAVAACVLVLIGFARAQNRGVYPLRMSTTRSGVTPEPGFTYVNQLLIYSRDKSKGPDGEVLATYGEQLRRDGHEYVGVGEQKALRYLAAPDNTG